MNLAVLSWIMFALGGIFLGWFMVITVRTLVSRRWKETTGLVTVSRLVTGSTTKVYKPDIEYLYRVDGTEYRGNRIFFGEGIATYYSRVWKKLMDRYHEGDKITVIYDPKNPGRAALERGMPFTVWLVLACSAGFVLLGTVLMLAASA